MPPLSPDLPTHLPRPAPNPPFPLLPPDIPPHRAPQPHPPIRCKRTKPGTDTGPTRPCHPGTVTVGQHSHITAAACKRNIGTQKTYTTASSCTTLKQTATFIAYLGSCSLGSAGLNMLLSWEGQLRGTARSREAVVVTTSLCQLTAHRNRQDSRVGERDDVLVVFWDGQVFFTYLAKFLSRQT